MHESLDPEKVAYWFLRLNGCFTITNLIVHPARRGSQESDADIIAVRFPHHVELGRSNRVLLDHELFTGHDKIDLILAELKRGHCELDQAWLRVDSKVLEYFLEYVGAFNQADMHRVADELRRFGGYQNESFRVRLFSIGNTKDPRLVANQLDWTELLGFIHGRFSRERRKSQHDQWDDTGNWLYEEAQIRPLEEFVTSMKRQMSIQTS
jgi:hypothetical protein